jgi:hypothetical protein
VTKQVWQAHMAAQGFEELSLAHMKSGCPTCKARRATRKATLRARTKRAAMKSLGLTAIRVGGRTVWE